MTDPTPPSPDAQAEARRRRRAVLLVAAGVVLLCVLVAIYAWFELSDVGLSTNGYIALALGIIGTLALGLSLGGLLIYSNRYGYDERASRRHDDRG